MSFVKKHFEIFEMIYYHLTIASQMSIAEEKIDNILCRLTVKATVKGTHRDMMREKDFLVEKEREHFYKHVFM